MKGDYCYAAFSKMTPVCMLHFEIIRFNHNIMKSIICDWNELKKVLKDHGMTGFVITKRGNLAENTTFVKFLGKLGLATPKEALIAEYEV